MSIFTIPYTFKAGMEAIANEVNANFNAIISYLNELQSKFADNDNVIANLPNTYANINGSYNEQFNVKDATLDTHAINKRQLDKYTSTMILYIYGLKLTKEDDTHIIVSDGQCYSNPVDGEREILELTTPTSYEITSITQNTTYNVFIAKEEDSSVSEIIITTNSAPSSSYVYYRLIGTVKTKSDASIIDVVTSLSNTVSNIDKSFNVVNQAITKNNGAWQMTANTMGVPDDGSIYNVWISGSINGTGSGAGRSVSSDIFPSTQFLRLDSDASRSSYASNIVTIPMSSDGYIQVNGNSCKVIGYMRA